MKTKTKLIIGCLATGVILTGCVTKNPNAGKIIVGTTNVEPAYIIDPRVQSTGDTIKSVATQLAPLNPYAGITDLGINFGVGLVTAASSWLLAKRNAKAQLDTMAAGVVKAGASSVVLDHASDTPHLAPIAEAIAANTGANVKLGATNS